MTIDWHIIWTVLLWHYIADFHCQTHEMAINKSKSLKWLSLHCLVYGLVMFIMMSFWSPLWIIINTLAHFVTDFFTSRWSSRLYKEERFHDFFCVIGLDQLIHCVTMFGTYIILDNAGYVYSPEQVLTYLGLN